MKKIISEIAISFILITATILIVVAIRDEFRRDEERQDELMELINERNYIDSLYHDHMSRCSYILQDQVTVGHGGVLYSSYHIKNK